MFASTLTIIEHIRYALKSAYINRGVEPQAIYLGSIQWELLKNWAREHLHYFNEENLDNEIDGVPVFRVQCESHLRVS
jgi:hypothetical protein